MQDARQWLRAYTEPIPLAVTGAQLLILDLLIQQGSREIGVFEYLDGVEEWKPFYDLRRQVVETIEGILDTRHSEEAT